MRIATIVSYDISDPKRLAKVGRVCADFGDRLQKSVWQCLLTRSERMMLEDRLRRAIKPDEDQVIFVALGAAGDGVFERCVTAMGRPYVPAERQLLLV